ncbi:hypothetical protein ACOME3_006423 [Neoechinorhynchus agilis]
MQSKGLSGDKCPESGGSKKTLIEDDLKCSKTTSTDQKTTDEALSTGGGSPTLSTRPKRKSVLLSTASAQRPSKRTRRAVISKSSSVAPPDTHHLHSSSQRTTSMSPGGTALSTTPIQTPLSPLNRSNTYVMDSSSASPSSCCSLNNRDVYAWSLTENLRNRIDQSYPFALPDDFFQLYFYCAKQCPSNPKLALFKSIGVALCGPYDYACMEIQDWILHCRHFYDVPQFTTIARVPNTGIHLGYYRHAPSQMPSFVAINDESRSCKFKVLGLNVFSALRNFASVKKQSKLFVKVNNNREFACAVANSTEKDMHSSGRDYDLGDSQQKAPMKPFCVLINDLSLAVSDECDPLAYDDDVTNKGLLTMLDNYCERRSPNVNAKTVRDDQQKARAQLEKLLSRSREDGAKGETAHVLKFALNLFLYGDKRVQEYARSLGINAMLKLGPSYHLFKLIVESHWNGHSRRCLAPPDRRRKPKIKHFQ